MTALEMIFKVSKGRKTPTQQLQLFPPGWLGWAMVLGSFQCWGVLLLLHVVGQGSALLAAGVGRGGGGLYFYIFHLSFFSNVLSFACPGTVPLLTDRLDMTSLLTGP